MKEVYISIKEEVNLIFNVTRNDEKNYSFFFFFYLQY